MSVESLLQYAFDRFDENNYDEAVKAFIAAHIASDNAEQKNDIFEVVNENFIKPNEEEFENAFSENLRMLIDKGMLTNNDIPNYDDNSLLMVPVSDTTYYVWSKTDNRFYSGQHYDFTKEETADVYRSIDSIIIDGFSNLKMILDVTVKEKFSHEYIVLEDEKSRNEFFSFFMIPGVAKQLDDEVKIFTSRQELMDYLCETGNYIPRTIKSASGYDYAVDMSELHKKRISEAKHNRPMIAITMPTFNRGKIALENVKRLQGLLYDEEVEFIICNNSSTEEVEYYEEIAKLAKSDSRIKYYEKPSKGFHYSIENVFGFCETEFALFCSDEDYIIYENFGHVLEEINKNRDYGVICFGVLGENYYLEEGELSKPPGSSGLQAGFGCTYVTGICLKPGDIRDYNLIERFSKFRENLFYIFYAHCVYTAYLAHKKGLYMANIPCFFDSVGNMLYTKDRDTKKEPPEHIKLEHRMEQARTQIEILVSMDATKDEMMNCILNVFLNLYMRIRIGYGYYYEEMIKMHTWDEACDLIDQLFRKIVGGLGDEGILDTGDVLVLILNYEKRIEQERLDVPIDFRDVVKVRD